MGVNLKAIVHLKKKVYVKWQRQRCGQDEYGHVRYDKDREEWDKQKKNEYKNNAL